MNKRYIDFVPVKKEEGGAKRASNGGAKKVVISRTTMVRAVEKPVEKPVNKPVNKSVNRTVNRPVSKPVIKAGAPKMNIPQNHFINTNKVAKRPLSRNVYKKEVKAPVEEPKGPVTIIEEPENKGRMGLIITIIITIILGAAAGTVAFLLLPK